MIALLRVQTSRCLIRLAEPVDAPELLRHRVENREHFMPWEPAREGSYYTLEQCAQSIVEGREAAQLDRAYPFIVFSRNGQEMVGSFTLANVVRGPFQACLLGYGVAARWQGHALMAEALEAGLTLAFGQLDLHRVMANYLPRNERSARLLARLGFEREGYARAYLRIAGAWEDHVLTAKIRDAD